MSKFLDQTGLSHFWSKIKTLLAGKADKSHTHTSINNDLYVSGDINVDGGILNGGQPFTDYVDAACSGVYDLVSKEKADAGHTHDSFDGNLYVDGVLDADAGICIGGEYLHDIFADVNHTHTFDNLEVQILYATGTISTDGNISAEGDILYNGGDSISQTLENIYQEIDELKTDIETMPGGASHKFQLLGRQTLAANGVADLSTFLSAYDELMIIVRTQSSASVTIGPANNTSGSSGFLCSKSLSGTQYTKIMVNKTNEGYLAWDVGGSIGWTNSTTYKYLRNYVASGTVSMSVVVHGR